MTWNDILAAAWKVILPGATAASVSFALGKKYGDKWLDARFSARLELLKHEQTKQIESIRPRVQWEFSRVSKIHEKEFEVLPAAWLMLNEAHGRTANVVGRLKEYPDLDNMDDVMFREVVAGMELPNFRKEGLLAPPSPHRRKYHNEMMEWIELDDAEKAQVKLNNYLIQHQIFMETALAGAFRAASVANSDYRIHKQNSSAGSFSSSHTHFSKVEPQMRAIEAMINAGCITRAPERAILVRRTTGFFQILSGQNRTPSENGQV